MIAYRQSLCLILSLMFLPLSACVSTALPSATAAKPVLVVRPDHLNFVIEAGRAYASEQVIAVSNAGGGLLDWSMGDNALWITLEQVAVADNSTGSAVKVRLDTSGLAAGTYTGFITIEAGTALNSPVYVPVYLDVRAAASIQQPPATAVKQGEVNAWPAEANVVWQNRIAFMKYTLVNACLVTGSVTNADRVWYMDDVTMVSRSGRSVTITQVIPPGETVMYRRYIPCYQFEEVTLKYNWRNPR